MHYPMDAYSKNNGNTLGRRYYFLSLVVAIAIKTLGGFAYLDHLCKF